MNIASAMNSLQPVVDTRPWWKKKTNWGIALFILGKLMYAIPVTAPYAPFVDAVGTALAGYGIADRAGKPNKGE